MTFAPGLLTGAGIALGGSGPVADVIATRLRSLGATVVVVPSGLFDDEDGLAAWASEHAPWRALVVATSDAFGSGGSQRLTAAMEGSWRAARGLATGALIDAEEPTRIVFVAPRPGAGAHAGAARASLENLARTLSVEWARHGITPVALAPGDRTTDGELAELTCFLVSAAGGYFSGCVFELGGLAAV